MAMITDASIRAAIKSAASTGRPATLRDPGRRGDGRLCLMVRPARHKPIVEWYAAFYRDGRRHMLKIGNYPKIRLADARRIYSDEYEPVISAGEDPRGPDYDGDGPGTVGQLFAAYVANMKGQGKTSWAEYQRALLTAKYAAADALGREREARDIKPRDIAGYLARMYKRGSRAHAGHLRAYMHAAFQWGMKSAHDYTQSGTARDWGITANPVSAVPRDNAATKPGTRHLSPDELRAFWVWLEAHPCQSSSVLQLLIATGQRVTELTDLSRDQYNADEGLLVWNKTKAGRPHVLPLPRVAGALLDALPTSTAGLYFPQPGRPGKPMTHFTVRHHCKEYVDEAGVQHFSPRDLRRTWKTLAGLAGISKDIRDRLQNHALRDVSSMHYDRHEYLAEKRAAMKVWSDWLDGVLSK